jgi:D-xylose reductase
MVESENKDFNCPSIGLGTCNLKEIEEVVYQSIKDCTRLIDTASGYRNEEQVGKGIKRAIDEGLVKREDLFVVTKCGLREKTDPETAINNSLKKLNLDYVDLYLDHWPSGKYYGDKEDKKLENVPLRELWGKMETLVEKKLTRFIGVSNYNVQLILSILSFCKIKPAVNEVEFHPYLYQKDLKEFCDKENIKIFSYNPLVKGGYCRKHEKAIKEKQLDLLNEEIIKNLAKKYSKTTGQIILNWHIKVGVIPIPGTTNPNRMKENLGGVGLKMEENEYQEISKLYETKKYRFCDSFGIYGIDIFA